MDRVWCQTSRRRVVALDRLRGSVGVAALGVRLVTHGRSCRRCGALILEASTWTSFVG